MNRQQQCDEWHIPYFPSEEECREEEARGDYEYDQMKQEELDADV